MGFEPAYYKSASHEIILNIFYGCTEIYIRKQNPDISTVLVVWVMCLLDSFRLQWFVYF